MAAFLIAVLCLSACIHLLWILGEEAETFIQNLFTGVPNETF